MHHRKSAWPLSDTLTYLRTTTDLQIFEEGSHRKDTEMTNMFSHSVVSNSLWPYGLQPTRLLCPWDFPGRLPLSTPGDLPDPNIEPMSLVPLAPAGRFFITVPPGKLKLKIDAWIKRKKKQRVRSKTSSSSYNVIWKKGKFVFEAKPDVLIEE